MWFCIWNSPLSLKSLSQRGSPQSGRRRHFRPQLPAPEVFFVRSHRLSKPSSFEVLFVRSLLLCLQSSSSSGIERHRRKPSMKDFLRIFFCFKLRGLGDKNAKVRVGSFSLYPAVVVVVAFVCSTRPSWGCSGYCLDVDPRLRFFFAEDPG